MKKKIIISVVFIIICIITIAFTLRIKAGKNEQYIYSESSEDEKKLYQKWNEEQKEYERKSNIVNDLLNKHYPKEKNTIDEMRLNEIEENGRKSVNVDYGESTRKSNKECRTNSKIM